MKQILFLKAQAPMKQILFLKAHVKSYTRQSGVFVREHEDKRVKKTTIFYHGTDADIPDGRLSLARFGEGAIAQTTAHGSSWTPAVYLTDSKDHAAWYGDKTIEVQVDTTKSIKVNAKKQLTVWAKENGYKSAQEMIDDYYDGNAYQAYSADSEFDSLAKQAKAEGKHVVIADFGDLTMKISDRRYVEVGKVAIVIDEKAMPVQGKP